MKILIAILKWLIENTCRKTKTDWREVVERYVCRLDLFLLNRMRLDVFSASSHNKIAQRFKITNPVIPRLGPAISHHQPQMWNYTSLMTQCPRTLIPIPYALRNFRLFALGDLQQEAMDESPWKPRQWLPFKQENLCWLLTNYLA